MVAVEVAESAVEVAEAAVVGVVPPQYGAEGVVVAEVLTVARGPALAAVAAADCGEWGAVVELRAASVAAAGPAVAVEAGPRAGRPAVARIADHRG